MNYKVSLSKYLKYNKEFIASMNYNSNFIKALSIFLKKCANRTLHIAFKFKK